MKKGRYSCQKRRKVQHRNDAPKAMELYFQTREEAGHPGIGKRGYQTTNLMLQPREKLKGF